MKFFIIVSFYIATLCASSHLEHIYYVDGNEIMLSDIVKVKQKDKKLFSFDVSKNTLRVSEKKLIKLLKKDGYDFQHKHSYIQFSKKSPISTQKIENAVKNYYKEHYKQIEIHSIEVHPRSYIEKLPNNYTVLFQNKAYLSKDAVIYIKTPKNREVFFNSTIKANIDAFVAKKMIRRDEELSFKNVKKKSIMLQKFRALPVQDINTQRFQAKHTIRSGRVITQRDIVNLYYVKRGDDVSVSLKENGISISFSAKALRNGHLNDTIYVQNSNKKKIKVRVTGKNKAEVQ